MSVASSLLSTVVTAANSDVNLHHITKHLVLASQNSSRLIALTSESTSEDIKSAHDATKVRNDHLSPH